MEKLIKIPKDINPDGVVNIKRASEITGIDQRTIRHWISVPGNGLRAYKIGGRIHLKVREFLQWIERNATIV